MNSLAKDFMELALEKNASTYELLTSLLSAMFATALMATNGEPEAERISALLELRRMFDHGYEHTMALVLEEAEAEARKTLTKQNISAVLLASANGILEQTK